MEDAPTLYREAVRTLRHDSRNLLGAVSIMSEHLEGSGDPRLQRYGAYLCERVAAMVRLTERVEVLEGIGEAETSKADLESLVETAMEAAGLDDSAPPLGARTVELDPRLSALALGEVLDNAAKTGTKIAITVEDSRDRLVLRVADQGAGISPTARQKLFVPFTGARRAGGSGLGLPIAEAAMRAQRGSVEIERTGEDGTVVALTWPKPQG